MPYLGAGRLTNKNDSAGAEDKACLAEFQEGKSLFSRQLCLECPFQKQIQLLC
jgi:hypothetical protein